MKASKWTLLAVVASVWLVFDQATKYLAVEHLTHAFQVANAHTLPEKLSAFVTQKDLRERGLDNRAPVVVAPFWNNVYAQNPGAAWGFLAGSGQKFRVPFFHLVSLAAVIFILSYYRKLRDDQRYLQFALALVLGGALGNALDRILRSYVIDFIDWFYGSYHWPTFNVADSGISVGLVLLFLEMMITKKPAARTSPSPKKA
jgi:signal peptidase II